jgi:hypothetical protein
MEDLIKRLQASWHREDVSPRPGLSHEEIDAFCKKRGVVLPLG